MKRYPLLLQALENWCDQENLMEVTKETYVGDTNRILESIIAGLSEDEILDLMRKHGFEVKGSAYLSIIKILKYLISQRPRDTV